MNRVVARDYYKPLCEHLCDAFITFPKNQMTLFFLLMKERKKEYPLISFTNDSLLTSFIQLYK